MADHESPIAVTNEWLTPPGILNTLGPFDLDPCSPVNRPWDTARNHYTINDDGLIMPWFGRVWCNPPYGRYAAQWMLKMSRHGNGIAFLFARTETLLFFESVWSRADAILFLRGRIKFYTLSGIASNNCAGAPSVLIAYGAKNVSALKKSGLDGKLVFLKPDSDNLTAGRST